MPEEGFGSSCRINFDVRCQGLSGSDVGLSISSPVDPKLTSTSALHGEASRIRAAPLLEIIHRVLVLLAAPHPIDPFDALKQHLAQPFPP